tara:strand:+ start:386 stop:658 length:273 start_codon:yes stop_codon:yes gene_type:complete
MVGDKKYTLNEKGVYVDKDGYGSKALGFQIPKKVRKNAQGEWELVPKKKPEHLRAKKKKKQRKEDDNKTSIDPKLYGNMLERIEYKTPPD